MDETVHEEEGAEALDRRFFFADGLEEPGVVADDGDVLAIGTTTRFLLSV